MTKTISNLIISMLLLFAVLLPTAALRAQDITSDADIDALIERYLQNLAESLPPGQQDQIDVYRKYIKDTLAEIVPPGVIARELQAIQEIFPTYQAAPGAVAPPITRTTTDQTLVLKSEPASPTPKSPVIVTANFNVGESFPVPDVQKQATTTFNWYLDNVFVPAFSGIGKNTLNFTSGVLGTVHTVRLQARLVGGRTVNASLLIPVVDADIVWYTDSYTPPGYRGKALATFQSPIVVVAQTFIPASFGLLNYVWTIDNDTPLNAYGIGVNQALIGLAFGLHTVEVRITDLAGNIDLTRRITIPRTQPRVLFHRTRTSKHDTETVARESFEASPAITFSLAAVPYFFNAQSLNGLRFSWLFDKNPLASPQKNPDLFTLNIGQVTLRPGTRVQRTLELVVENKNPKAREQARFSVPLIIR